MSAPPSHVTAPPLPHRVLKSATGKIKRAKVDRKLSPDVLASLTEPVFTGIVHILNPTFKAPGTFSYSFPGPAMGTILAYYQNAGPKCVEAVQQWGPATASIDLSVRSPGIATPLPVSAGPPHTYTDADLEKWIDTVCADFGIPAGDAVIVLNPPSNAGQVVNTDAPLANGYGGYHSMTPGGRIYSFVNVNNAGTNFTLLDETQQYAQSSSHEFEEFLVDPKADSANPEVCDPCAGNCGAEVSYYWDASGRYLGYGGIGAYPAGTGYYTAAVLQVPPGWTPGTALPCPPSSYSLCDFVPVTPSDPVAAAIALITQGAADYQAGNTTKGMQEILEGEAALTTALGV